MGWSKYYEDNRIITEERLELANTLTDNQKIVRVIEKVGNNISSARRKETIIVKRSNLILQH